jgi:hypothetical protein
MKLETRVKNMKNINSIDCSGVRLQLTVTYTYIGNRT